MSELPQVQAPARHIAWLMERSTDADADRPAGPHRVRQPCLRDAHRLAAAGGARRTPALLKSGAQQPDLYRQLGPPWAPAASSAACWSTAAATASSTTRRSRSGRCSTARAASRTCCPAGATSASASPRWRNCATAPPTTRSPGCPTARCSWSARPRRSRARAGTAPAAVVLVDVDAFKRINDQHGRAAGDAVLGLRRAHAAMRAQGRHGGAPGWRQFGALLLEGSGDERRAASLLAVIARLLTQPVVCSEASLPVSTGLGAPASTCAARLDLHLLEQADGGDVRRPSAAAAAGASRAATGRPSPAPLGIAHGGGQVTRARPAAPL